MKCSFALDHLYSDRISIKLKYQIEDHIAHCPVCHAAVASNEKIELLLHNIGQETKIRPNYSELMKKINCYREKKTKRFWSRVEALFPIEPASRRLLAVSTVFAIILLLSFFDSGSLFHNRSAKSNGFTDDFEYLREHALMQDSNIFSKGAVTQSFIGLGDFEGSIR